MNRNDLNMFDELVRQKLEGYSEPSDMNLMQNIHARKTRILKWYGLYRILIITSAVGLGLLGSYYFGNQLLSGDSRVIVHSEQLPSNQVSSSENDAGAQPIYFNGNVTNQQTSTVVGQVSNQSEIQLTQTSGLVNQQKSNNKPPKQSSYNYPDKGSESPLVATQPHTSNDLNTKSKADNVTIDTDKQNQAPRKEKSTCEVAFSYYVSYNGEYHFSNFSSATHQLTYTWDFGDGTTSNTSAPQHAYARQGEYDVKLTVSDASGCSNSLIKHLSYQNKVSEKPELNLIKGIVKAGNEPVASAVVELIQINASENDRRVYKVTTNKNGEFIQSGIKAGMYVMYAHPTVLTPSYHDAYWGNTAELSLAPSVVVTGDENEVLQGYAIDLLYHPTEQTGNIRPNGSPSDQTREFILFDKNNNIVGSATFDANGNLVSQGPLNGTYTVVDKATGQISGVVTFGNKGPSSGESSKGALENTQHNSTQSIFINPNPATNSMNLSMERQQDASSVIVLDGNGRVMLESTIVADLTSNKIPIDISRLAAGDYYVMVIMKDGSIATTRLLKTDSNTDR